MLDAKMLSLETPEEELNALAGSQIFYIQAPTFTATRVIETARVSSASKKTGPVVIVFEDYSMVWFTEPVTISYYPKGEL